MPRWMTWLAISAVITLALSFVLGPGAFGLLLILPLGYLLTNRREDDDWEKDDDDDDDDGSSERTPTSWG